MPKKRISKKRISWMLVITMMLSLMPFSAMTAYAEAEGDWTYTLYDGDTTAAITGYTGADTEIAIPSEIAGKLVTRIASNAFLDNTTITSVTIPDSVLRIESGAFQNSMVSTIDLGDGLTYIGQNAFNGSKLINVTIPDSVTHIDNNSFAMNRNLSSVSINGNNLLTLGDGAFSTTALSTIRIPTSLTTIASWAFSDTYLSSLTIPANITSIGYFAFGNNANLNSVEFEGNAPTMANYVFSIPSSGFTVYYYNGATGFTTPTWTAGYATLNTVELSVPDTQAPNIYGQSVLRSDFSSANVRFISDESGTYYYIVTDDNAAPFTDDLSGWTLGTSISADETVTFSPLGLTAGEKYLHLVVKDSSDNVSDVLTVAMSQEYYYAENFEVYPLDTTIASGELAPITQINSGTGGANQKVTATIGNDSDKMLCLSSASSWASDQVVLLDESAIDAGNKYVFEGDVYALGTTSWQLRFSFTTGVYSASTEAGVFFKNGNIVSISDSERVLLTGYTANQWYNVKIEAVPSAHTYAVYVDGILLDDTLTLPSGIDRLAITSGHGFTTYYDNLEFYVVPPHTVCKILDTNYSSLDAALGAVTSGQTITLLEDIEYNENIWVGSSYCSSFTMDLNGYSLTVSDTEVPLGALDGYSLSVTDNSVAGGGILQLMTSAAESAPTGVAAAGLNSRVSIDSKVTASITATGNNSKGIDVGDSGIVEIGNGTVTGGTYGVYANNYGNATVNGNVVGNVAFGSSGIYAQNGATITVTGDVMGAYYGAISAYGGLVDVTGNVTADTNGLSVEYGGLAEIHGIVTGATALYVRNGEGWDAPSVVVTGNVISTGNTAVNVSDASDIDITGDITGRIDVSGSTSTSPEIIVNGDLTVSGGYGITVYYGGTVTINGTIIGASPYLYLNGTDISYDDHELSGGYCVYSNYLDDEYDRINTVRVLAVEPPSAENLTIDGDPIVGATLTGTYDFNSSGNSEGETSFRWLRIFAKPSLLGEPYLLYTTNNISGVTSSPDGPTNPVTFTVTETSQITKISNYHYGSSDSPGTISLQEAGGAVYGPWDAVLDGYWRVYPNITVPAGTYTVIDSKPDSWSFNYESGYSGMTEIVGYTVISGATEENYTLQNNDLGKSIMLEVTAEDVFGNAGDPALSSPFGSISAPPENQAPVLTSNWDYSTVCFGQNYPFTISVTDYENSPNTKLYSYIDSAAPSQVHNFAVVPGTVNITLSPTEGVLSVGSHTLNYYATDASGATSATLALTFTIASNLSDNASLSSISIPGINLNPAFDQDNVNYNANVSNSISSITINAVSADDSAMVSINGVEGSTKLVALNVGNNVITVEVTAEDGVSTKTYTININRATGGSSGGSSSISPTVIVTTDTTDDSTSNSITVDSDVWSGTGSASMTNVMVAALLDKAEETGGTSKGDQIEIKVDTKSDIEKLKLSIPQTELAKIASRTNADLDISSSFISIVFDGKAVDTISGAESGGTVSITAARVADINGRPVYDLTVMNGSIQVSDFGGGHATISIPYELKPGENPNSVVIYYLADDDSLKAVRGHYDADSKTVIFKTAHFSSFVIGYNPISFNDVATDVWYKNSVDFIASRGITSGTGNNMFNPEVKLTRAQFVVLLMNAYQIRTQNQGEYSQIQNFSDAGNTYYTDYLLAAKALGIVNGVGNNMFAPEKEITRQEMFVMLYNALRVIDEVPAYVNNTQLSSFNDADKIASWANEAVSSLVKTGTIGGYNNNLNLAVTTTRAEIAQVLYNLLSK
ncbi:MAG: leucine-rich repeat protein [Lachnospiraceae bacterium]|nr:leucine-rich repeat protein [Lachnospiraceae bacterium]